MSCAETVRCSWLYTPVLPLATCLSVWTINLAFLSLYFSWRVMRVIIGSKITMSKKDNKCTVYKLQEILESGSYVVINYSS